MWRGADCGSFIAVGQLNRLEEISLSVFNSETAIGHRDVEMKLGSRSIVFTGHGAIEEARREMVGEADAREAG